MRAARLAANRLDPRCTGGVADVVRAVCGIQAQDAAAARLSVRVRTQGLTAADVDAAPDVVRVWAWRGTLHLLAREDVPWVLALVAPGAQRSVAARWRELGLDDGIYERAREVILARVPATRAELREALEGSGVDASGQRLPHLLGRVAREGRLHHPLDGTFAPLDATDWPSREEALQQLGRRYAAAYGPADADDLAAWSGVPKRDARAAWVPAGDDGAATSSVRLLPAFDTYLLGYKDRSHAVPPEHERKVRPGGGWIHPVVLVDGVAAATWKPDGSVDAWADIPAGGLESELADVRRFTAG